MGVLTVNWCSKLSKLLEYTDMKLIVLLFLAVSLCQAAPQGGVLPADLQPNQMTQYLDDPTAAEELIQCLSDFGASTGLSCPEGLRRANELAGTLGDQGGCTECTPEESQIF